MLKHKRIIAAFTCIALIFTLFFSMFYIVKNANHDCNGENCPICQEIQLCSQTLKNVGTAVVVTVLFAFSLFSLFIFAFSPLGSKRRVTLVSLKVKLTN